MVVASGCLVWLQPHGAADGGLFVAVALAGIRLSGAPSIAVLVLAAAACVAPALHADRAAGVIAETGLGIAAFYLVARFGRSAVEAHEQGTSLMRAMLLEFPDDPTCDTLDRQYMLGGALLVAPICARRSSRSTFTTVPSIS